MKFKCNQEYFIKAVKEELEDMLVLFYMMTWVTVKFFLFVGLFPLLDKAKTFAFAVRERWNSRIEAVSSHGINQYAWYVLMQRNGREWMICDPIMLKYWIFHAFNLFLPPMQFDGLNLFD